MRSSRRRFLKCLGVGAVGATGALLPTTADGGLFCRRRRAVACQEVGGPVHPRLLTQDPPVYIEYPPPFGGQVGVTQQGGDFYAWGFTNQGVTNFSITLTSDPAGNNPIACMQQQLTGADAPLQMNGWAYRISGIMPATTFYVKLSWTVMGTMYTRMSAECTATAF